MGWDFPRHHAKAAAHTCPETKTHSQIRNWLSDGATSLLSHRAPSFSPPLLRGDNRTNCIPAGCKRWFGKGKRCAESTDPEDGRSVINFKHARTCIFLINEPDLACWSRIFFSWNKDVKMVFWELPEWLSRTPVAHAAIYH